MGYSTDFTGHLDITPALTKRQADYINLLASTRRMKRDIKVLWSMYKGKHGNPFATEQTPIAIYGTEGEFFAMDDGNSGQNGHGTDKSIIDYNTPPGHMLSQGLANFNKVWNANKARVHGLTATPGLWCGWTIEADGEKLCWDGGEKFYDYVDWLRFLIDRFFEPWGVKLNGEIEWAGEDSDDKGKIRVKNNVVKAVKAQITYPGLDDED
jgi:hypothetical protein